MTSVDLFALGVFAISLVLGLLRGLTREVLSLLAWCAAFYAAKTFAPLVARFIPGIDSPALSHAAALVLVFVAVLILASLLAAALGGLIKVAGLGAYDSLLGGLFGVLRGSLILLMLTLLAGLTALPKSHAWRTSLIHRPLEQVAGKCKPWLPADLAALIQYP
jgi:membrane protein required for colicin V production